LSDYDDRLVEFIWSKIHDRFSNTTLAFRFFDTKSKGRIRKSDLVAGLEKLQVHISQVDITRIWNWLDPLGKIVINFTGF